MERLDLFKAYFTDEVDYYLNQLNKYEKHGRCSFNFWAGFFGMTWFVYRKMYIQTLVIAIVIFILAFITGILLGIYNPDGYSNETSVMIILYPVSFVSLGFIGNTAYMKKSIQVVDGFIAKHGLENIDISLKNSLKQKGGITLIGTVIFILGMGLLQFLLKAFA